MGMHQIPKSLRLFEPVDARRWPVKKAMPNEIIPYLEMCQREGVSLQRGMNVELGHNHSVILMSVRPNAPYADRFEDAGTTLIYE